MTVGFLGWRQAATALLLLLAFVGIVRETANAQSARIAAGPSPVLFVQIVGGDLTIRSWEQSAVQVEADPAIETRHIAAEQVAQRIPQRVYLWSQTMRTPDGTTLKLEPETFLLPVLGNAPHDAVIVRGNGNATITVPSGTALIISNVRRGTLNINGYKNGVFVAHVANGAVQLENVTGTGAVQVGKGPFTATDSNFTRLRVRTVRGDIQFENCNATQIEATSLTGAVMYDNGTFSPGLARFESERGNVLLGVSGNGVQVGAHSGVGQIFSDAAGVSAGQTDTQATIGHGGPVVTATSGSGSVIFYSGALRGHPVLQRRFALHARRLQQKPPQYGHIHLKRMLR